MGLILLFSHFFRTPDNLHGHTGSMKVFSGGFFALLCGRPRRVYGFCELRRPHLQCYSPFWGAALLKRSLNVIHSPPTWKLPHRNVQSGHDKGSTFCSKSCGGDRCRAPGSHKGPDSRQLSCFRCCCLFVCVCVGSGFGTRTPLARPRSQPSWRPSWRRDRLSRHRTA